MTKVQFEDKKVSVSTVEYAASEDSSQDKFNVEDEPKYSVFRQPRLWWRQNYLSWRFYVFIYACLALLATFVILTGLIIALAIHGVDRHGRITLSEGSCSKAKTSSFFGHLFISGMGTYMLSASAYVMVCLKVLSRYST
jgi:hypothetical protein